MALTARRKLLLTIILLIVIAGHVALFAAGGTWRRMGLALIAIDVISGCFVLAAVREMRKLDQNSPR